MEANFESMKGMILDWCSESFSKMIGSDDFPETSSWKERERERERGEKKVDY